MLRIILANPPDLGVVWDAVNGRRVKPLGVNLISKGRHERFVIDKGGFDAKMPAKRNSA